MIWGMLISVLNKKYVQKNARSAVSKRNNVCDTFFDEWGRTFENDWTKHQPTRLCNFEAQTRSMSLRRWLEKLCRFCFQTWHFCEEGVYKVYDKKDWTHLWWSLLMDLSGDRLVDIHTNPPLSLEIKCLFHLHKGFQCILMFQSGISRSVRYMEQMVLQSEGHLLLCWSPKNGSIKMLCIITYVTHLNA